jgi:hypothetical protein
MTKEIKFNDLIFQSFKHNENYDLIKHGMNRAKALILQDVAFEKATPTHQYNMCITIS